MSEMHSNEAYGPFVSKRKALSRRTFLKGAGIAMALPFLDSMVKLPCGRDVQRKKAAGSGPRCGRCGGCLGYAITWACCMGNSFRRIRARIIRPRLYLKYLQGAPE